MTQDCSGQVREEIHVSVLCTLQTIRHPEHMTWKASMKILNCSKVSNQTNMTCHQQLLRSSSTMSGCQGTNHCSHRFDVDPHTHTHTAWNSANGQVS